MARRLLHKGGMRIFVGFLIVAAAIGFFVSHRHTEEPAIPTPAPAATTAQPAAPRTTSEHNWAKHALDRVSDVKQQVAEGRKQDGAP